MHILVGEQFDDLGEHLLDETEGPFASGAIDVLLDAPEVADPVAAPAARQFGIGRNGGHGVPRHLDLGNDINLPGGGIGHDPADIALRIEAPVDGAVGLGANAPELRQTGIFPDLNGPELVVGQVPVELVQLVHGHHVQQLLDLLHRAEMTARIEHHPAIGHPGRIAYLHAGDRKLHAGNRRRALDPGGQQLHERLHAVEDAGARRGDQLDAVGRDGQFIPLLRDAPLRVETQRKGISGLAPLLEVDARRACDLLREIAGNRLQTPVREQERGPLREKAPSGTADQGLGAGNHRDGPFVDPAAGRSRKDGHQCKGQAYRGTPQAVHSFRIPFVQHILISFIFVLSHLRIVRSA